MEYDNPAGRLLTILEAGKKHPGNLACIDVWGILLDTDSRPLLMTRLGKVMELPLQAVIAIQDAFPTQDEKFRRHWYPQVTNAFVQQNLSSNWQSFIGQIDDHTLTYLHMNSELLETRATTKSIPDDSLLEVKTQLQEILDQVLASDQPNEVKKYLTRKLRALITSIEEYRLTGALPVLDAIDSAVGHGMTNVEYRSFLTSTELGGRLLDTLTAAANLVTVAVALPQLSAAMGLLT